MMLWGHIPMATVFSDNILLPISDQSPSHTKVDIATGAKSGPYITCLV
jgi:hypothetical protein